MRRALCRSHIPPCPRPFYLRLVGPLGAVVEGQPGFFVRVSRAPTLSLSDGPPAPIALVKWAMGDDGRMLNALPDLGYAGLVVEGMGAGHVPADVAPILGDLA